MLFRITSLREIIFHDSGSQTMYFTLRYSDRTAFQIKRGSEYSAPVKDGELRVYDREYFKEEYKKGSMMYSRELTDDQGVRHPQCVVIDTWLSERLFDQLLNAHMNGYTIHVGFHADRNDPRFKLTPPGFYDCHWIADDEKPLAASSLHISITPPTA